MNGGVRAVNCVMLRGGTSRGLVLETAELDLDPGVRDRQILRLFGSPDRFQVDGLGGASVQTSKLALIGAPTRSGADLDYTFAQVGITDAVVDFSGTCGNLAAAVALYATETGRVDAVLRDDGSRAARVALHNTHTGGLIVADVVDSAGVGFESGAEQTIFLDCAGMASGGPPAILPAGGGCDPIRLSDGRSVPVTLANIGNAMVYVRAADVGMTGDEAPEEIDRDPVLSGLLEEIRKLGGKRLSAAGVPGIDHAGARLPLLSVLSAPKPGDEADVRIRLKAVDRTHVAIAGSAAVSLAAIATQAGTIPSEFAAGVTERGVIRIAHPSGVMQVTVEREGENGFSRLAFERTARRLMTGVVYV